MAKAFLTEEATKLLGDKMKVIERYILTLAEEYAQARGSEFNGVPLIDRQDTEKAVSRLADVVTAGIESLTPLTEQASNQQ